MEGRTRKRILDFLETHANASTGQIARALGMNAPALRHHLAILLSDDRIEAVAAPERLRRGRPERRFRISESRQGSNLAMVADALLKASGDRPVLARQEKALEVLAKGLLSQLGETDKTATATHLMDALIEALNRLHYAAHWEAGAEGPRLSLGHCPYSAVIKEHPELCQMDARAVGSYTGARVRQLAKIDFESRSPAQCVFSLK